MNMVMKLPGLNMINRLGGALFGFLEALIIVWIVFVVVDMIVGTKLTDEFFYIDDKDVDDPLKANEVQKHCEDSSLDDI